MDDRIPQMVRSRRTDRGQVFELPRRDLGKARHLGLGLAAFGVVITTFMVFWMGFPLQQAFSEQGGLRWGLLAFGLLGTPGLLIGLGMVAGGLAMSLNWLRAEVVVTADRLLARERLGFIRWTRKRRLADIDRLALEDASAGNTPASNTTVADALHALSAICAEGASIKPMMVAPGYPLRLLEPLADQLAGLVGAECVRRDPEVEEDAVEGETDAPRANDVPPQPEGSRVVLQTHAEGISLAVPPVGLRRGSRGLFSMAILWNGIVLTIIIALGSASFSGAGEPLSEIWPVFLFLGFFLLIGLGMLMSAINSGRRQAVLVTRRDELMVRSISPFRTREFRWSTSDLAAIRMGPSGIEVNDVPVMELQIHLRQGRQVGLLRQLDQEHQLWIAAVLRDSLDVPERRSS